jgi:hypothetical protein
MKQEPAESALVKTKLGLVGILALSRARRMSTYWLSTQVRQLHPFGTAFRAIFLASRSRKAAVHSWHALALCGIQAKFAMRGSQGGFHVLLFDDKGDVTFR